MSWRTNDSRVGAAIWDTEAMSAEDLLCRNEELVWLAKQDKRRSWRLINGRIARSGDPTAGEGLYATLQALPPNAAQTGAAMTTGTSTPGVGLWSSAVYTPILANAVLAPSVYELKASGTLQTSVTAGTLTVLPQIGVGLVNAAPTTSQVLGVSGAATLAASGLTSIFRLEGELTVRSTGASGTAWFMGTMFYGITAVPVTVANTNHLLLGGTAATVDFTGVTANYPGGLLLSGWNAGSGTVTIVTNSVHLLSLN
jgi:hypothetical protein